MKIYIASSHKTAHEITKELNKKTQHIDYMEFFFPEILGDSTNSVENMKYVDSICCKKIRECDMLVAIYPFGHSVSVELGRFLEFNLLQCNNKKQLIIFNTCDNDSIEFKRLRTEAMIIPHVNHFVNSIDELLIKLSQIKDLV